MHRFVGARSDATEHEGVSKAARRSYSSQRGARLLGANVLARSQPEGVGNCFPLGLDPGALQAAQTEGTQVLPGLILA